MDSGEKRLHELGYKQELRREMVCLWNLPLHNISKLISIYIFLTVNTCILLFFSSDSNQDTCNNILERSNFLWNTTIWPKPTLCWSCKLNMGMGCSLILHLVCWTCLGWDMLLLSSMFLFSYSLSSWFYSWHTTTSFLFQEFISRLRIYFHDLIVYKLLFKF